MIRVRIGEGWSSDPGVREGLRSADASPRRAAIRAIVDVVAVEVDGVDIGAGRTEGPVADGVLRLLSAADRLCAGDAHATVPFEDGEVELVLHRSGGQALLSVATLSRPARVLAHDVAVDLTRLAEAVREAAREFCAQVATLAPGAGRLPELRSLLAAARRSTVVQDGASPPPGRRLRRSRRRLQDASCSFELHDAEGRLASWRGTGGDLASLLVRGRVTLRAPSGQEVLSLEGAPYLLFRDLCAAAARIATAHGGPVSFDLPRPGPRATVRVAVADGEVRVGRAAPVRCDPLALALAIAEGAADLCAVVRSRAPAQERNALLGELSRSAEATRAQVVEAREGDRTSPSRRRIRVRRERVASGSPLGAGRVRRVVFRRLVARDLGAPAGPGLFGAGSRVVACGSAEVVGLEARTGAIAWKFPGGEAACASGGVVAVLRGDALTARDATSGTLLWTVRVRPDGAARHSLRIDAGARVLLHRSGPRVVALDLASGRELFAFAPPGATRIAVRPLGPLVLSAADTGMVHALDRSGAVVWRLRGPGPLAAPPVASARSCLLAFRCPTGATLAAVDPATGARLFETALDLVPAAAPVRFAGRIALAGRVAGEGVVVALEEDGSPAWTVSSPVGPETALASRTGGLLAKAPDGGCAALDRDGSVRWLLPGSGLPGAPGNAPPVPVRGLVVLASDEVRVLDAADGALVGRIPAHAPSRLLVDDDLGVWTLDADGLLVGAQLRGHLALVDAPRA